MAEVSSEMTFFLTSGGFSKMEPSGEINLSAKMGFMRCPPLTREEKAVMIWMEVAEIPCPKARVAWSMSAR